MVLLVAVLEAAEDGDGVFDAWLVDEHRLETPGQRGVLLHVLAILIERGGADAVQLAARQRRLQDVGGIHRPFGFAGADQRVHLIYEKDDAAFGRRHFREHGFQALFKFAAELGPGDQRAHVERQELLVLDALRHVAIDDPERQAFGDGRLAHAGLADQHRVVLGATAQDLDGAADFLVAPDHRIELALAGILGEVSGVFLQRVVLIFGGG